MEKLLVTFELCTMAILPANYRQIFEIEGALTSKTFKDVLKIPGLNGTEVLIEQVNDSGGTPMRRMFCKHNGKEEYFFIYANQEDLKKSKVVVQQFRPGITVPKDKPYHELNAWRKAEQFEVAA